MIQQFNSFTAGNIWVMSVQNVIVKWRFSAGLQCPSVYLSVVTTPMGGWVGFLPKFRISAEWLGLLQTIDTLDINPQMSTNICPRKSPISQLRREIYFSAPSLSSTQKNGFSAGLGCPSEPKVKSNSEKCYKPVKLYPF